MADQPLAGARFRKVDEVFLVRQYRASVDEYLLEIAAGKRDVIGLTLALRHLGR